MSDRLRMFLAGDFQARLAAVLPGLTRTDLEAFGVLVVRDGLVTDDGAAHADLVAWVQRSLDRRGRADGVPAVVPVRPLPAPAGALIGGVA